jgi:SAM-dependent MidA family methyltransferase
MYNKNIMKQLQGYVSRIDSIRVQLSDLSWLQGYATYYLEKVPYSFTTSDIFSTCISELIADLIKDNKKDSFNIYELGAGMGFLSRNILDTFKKTHPKFYKKTQYHVTDYAKPVIDEIKKLELLSGHKKNVSLKVFDVFKHKLNKLLPDLIFGVYLLDAFPVRHIEVENGEVYEIQVKTSITDNAVVFDTTCLPPKLLGFNDIKKLLKSNKKIKKSLMSRRVLDAVTEEYRRVPLDEIKGITKAELQDLRSFVDYLNPGKKIKFNYSYQMGNWLAQLLSRVSQESVIFFYDFGDNKFSKNEKIENMMLIAGSTAFYPVNFPYINFITNKMGFSYLQSEVENGCPQEVYICSQKNSKKIKTIIKEINIKEKMKNSLSSYMDFKHLMAKENDAAIKENIPKLAANKKLTHSILTTLTNHFYQKGDFIYAEKLAYMLQDKYYQLDYGSLLVLAQIYLRKERLEDAEICLDQAVEISKYIPSAYNYLSVLNYKQNLIEDYIKQSKLFLKYCRDNNFWKQLSLLAMIYYYSKKHTKAKRIIDWIIAIQKKHPNIVPKKDVLLLRDII